MKKTFSAIFKAGTSDGAQKAWESRRAGEWKLMPKDTSQWGRGDRRPKKRKTRADIGEWRLLPSDWAKR